MIFCFVIVSTVTRCPLPLPGYASPIEQSRSWYAILGDLDDYLYDAFGTLSTTVELSVPLAGVWPNPLRLLCPFPFLNPRDPGPTIENNAEACLAALAEGARVTASASRGGEAL